MMFFILMDSLIFWLVLGSVGIGVFGLAASERIGFATSLVLASLAFFQFFSDLKPLTWIVANPIYTVELVAAYFLVGVIWVYPKWNSFVRDVYDTAVEAKKAYTKRVSSGSIPVEQYMKEANKKAENAINDKFGYHVIGENSLAPSVKMNKSRIMGWMAYWPVSMIWTAINDPVRRAYEWIYSKITGSLQKMSDNKFKDI